MARVRDLGAADSTSPSRGTGTPPSRYSSPPSSSGAGLALLVSAAPDVSSEAPRLTRRGERSRRAFADAAAAAAAAHLLAFPPLASVGGGSAAALLASPATQRALSVVESVAWTRDAEARRGAGSGADAKGQSAARSAAQLRVEALRAALAAAAEEASTSGSLSIEGWRRCCDVFASLSSLWAHARDAEAEAEREAAELFRSRTKPPTALRRWRATTTRRRRRRTGALSATTARCSRTCRGRRMRSWSWETTRARRANQSSTANREPTPVSDHATTTTTDRRGESLHRRRQDRRSPRGDLLEEVVVVHRRVLGGLRGPPPPPPPPTRVDDPAAAAAAAKNPSGWWAASGAPPTPARYGPRPHPGRGCARGARSSASYDVGAKIARAAGLVDVPVCKNVGRGVIRRSPAPDGARARVRHPRAVTRGWIAHDPPRGGARASRRKI